MKNNTLLKANEEEQKYNLDAERHCLYVGTLETKESGRRITVIKEYCLLRTWDGDGHLMGTLIITQYIYESN